MSIQYLALEDYMFNVDTHEFTKINVSGKEGEGIGLFSKEAEPIFNKMGVKDAWELLNWSKDTDDEKIVDRIYKLIKN